MPVNLAELPQPFMMGRRISDAALDRFLAGESINELAHDYEATTEMVEHSIRCAMQLKLAPKTQTHLKKLLGRYIRGEANNQKVQKLYYAIRFAALHEFELPDWVIPEFRSCCAQMLHDLRSQPTTNPAPTQDAPIAPATETTDLASSFQSPAPDPPGTP